MKAMLPSVPCPVCGQPMSSGAFEPGPGGGAKRAADFGTCHRRCITCRVGISNAKDKPTLIHEDPIANVPPEVRIGARGTLAASLNVRNRPAKLVKFGFDTSEDAVTWTVFSYLHGQQQQGLARLYQGLFGISAITPPALLLWGAPVPGGLRELALAKKLVAVSNALSEVPASRSEPDVVLDFGSDGLVVIEVKYLSGNSGTTDASKFDRYVHGSPAFSNPAGTKANGLYELARNWRIAHDLAAGRPFVTVNLAKAATLNSTAGLPGFVASLATTSTQRFLSLSWRDFLGAARRATGGFPPWLDGYCQARGLP